MKILLDECIPRKLEYSLPDHECQTVPEAGRQNGSLLDLAESTGFEILEWPNIYAQPYKAPDRDDADFRTSVLGD